MTTKQDTLAAMRRDIGVVRTGSEWYAIDQAMIDTFVAMSGETTWIHTDPEKAKRDSPLGGTIAPGNMGIALMPKVSGPDSAYARYPRAYSLNQGWNRIRFLSPLLAGSRIRANSKLLSVEERPDGSARVEVEFQMEIEGKATPWVTGIKVGRFFFG